MVGLVSTKNLKLSLSHFSKSLISDIAANKKEREIDKNYSHSIVKPVFANLILRQRFRNIAKTGRRVAQPAETTKAFFIFDAAAW